MLIRRTKDCREAVGTFEYSDLTAYLLFVVGLNVPEDGDGSALSKLAQRGREGKPVALREIEKLSKKDPFTSLPRTAGLTKAVELFGSGIHRIVITESRSEDVIGVLSQIQLVNFFWVHGRHFSALEPLFSRTLGDLAIGSHAVYAIK